VRYSAWAELDILAANGRRVAAYSDGRAAVPAANTHGS
jgi:hypothetical protein